MTSAPMSAMIWVQYGPITIAVRSMTRSPAIGPVGLAIERFLAGRAVRQLEAVADVLVVSIRDDRKNEWRRDVSDRLRSEHTSELQSHVNLVCRLLLEKKKKIS